MAVRLYRESLCYFDSLVISPFSLLIVCDNAGIFGNAGTSLKIPNNILIQVDEDNNQLQNIISIIWKSSYPLLSSKLIDIQTKQPNLPISAFGTLRNRIENINVVVSSNKTPQRALREIRSLFVDLSLLGGDLTKGRGERNQIMMF
ncbi:MAG: hypothetical protein EZS28_053374 [Streblomastix strix]|uniref:Uncharacterized protein n=1 Tax=Streblomastix strix TaxID=222440 RepID=A0A5J4RCZ8_9EUKA|nr:MAG: hypothetical protein EZS28_053374 [Streblomastix strix]